MSVQQSPPVHQLRQHLEECLPKGGLERLVEEKGALEEVAPEIEKYQQDDREADFARGGLTKLAHHEELDYAERVAVEAIILPQTRPVIDIENDSFATPIGIWKHLGTTKKIRSRIEAAIPSVGRVELLNDPVMPYGGTAFVVGPDLLMTNRHVAEIFNSGLGIRGLRFRPGRRVGMDFRKEHVATEPIIVDVEKVVMVHPYWDMALLQVTPLPEDQIPLTLSTVDPAALLDREICVIGYPALDPRNDIDVQNRIFRSIYNVKRLQPGTLTGRQQVRSFENIVNALKHNSSTLGGNSGSAVVDLSTGQVVGLHFAGAYRKSNYAVPAYELARDPYVLDAGLNIEGRVEAGPIKWRPRWRVADPPDEIQASSMQAPRNIRNNPSVDHSTNHVGMVGGQAGAGAITLTLPLHVTVSLGQPSTPTAGDAIAPAAGAVEKPSTNPDPNYDNRAGYDPDFLPGGHRVQVPWLSDEQYANTVRNTWAITQRHVLPYNHFSVVMNRERRIAYFSAVNIDGTREQQVIRDDFNDSWSLDPRIDAAAQLDNEYYRNHGGVENPLDRGHLVRRLDPCWGDDRDEVIAAHHDTFHYTNSAPQHRSFNRTQSFWGGIEDYILDHANSRDLRVSLLTGPVFDDDDPVYMAPTGNQVQVPLQYWKVVAYVRENGSLSASGYLLSQSGHVDDMLEEFVFGNYRNHQVRIAEIESLTDLHFRGLADHDAFGDDEEGVPGGPSPRRPIESLDTIRI